MKHTKLLVAGVVVALVLAAFAAYKSLSHDSVLTATATPGSLLIEQYSPYVQQNGGISSALPIQTTSTMTSNDETISTTLAVGTSATVGTTLTVSATSTMADAVHTSAATTTVKVLSSSSTQGGCIQLNATSSATNVFLKLSPLGATSTFAGTAYWAYGTCE